MEFGKISNVDSVDWSLPADSEATRAYLQSQMPLTRPHFYLGAPAWGIRQWLGTIYPPKTKASDYLYHYSRAYQCIELNTSHYRIPSAEQVEKWASQTADNFLFCSKVHQDISHRRYGLADKTLLTAWYSYLNILKTKRGPCFLQLPPHFGYDSKYEFFQFLKQWPDEHELAIEFRHPSWFSERQILPALADYLRTRKIGCVITDVAGRRDVLHTTLSSDFTMVRFIGNDLHPSDISRMQAWAERLKEWTDLKLQRIFFFIHQPDDMLTPQMTQIVIKILNETCQADLAPLNFFENIV